MEFESKIIRNKVNDYFGHEICYPVLSLVEFFTVFIIITLIAFDIAWIIVIPVSIFLSLISFFFVYNPKYYISTENKIERIRTQIIKLPEKDKIIITENEIIFDNEIINIRHIGNIKIFIKNVNGEKHIFDAANHHEIKYSYGNGNFLFFDHVDKTYKIEFYITSRGHLDKLGNLLYEWHKKIEFEEYYKTHKTYGLRSLDYKEIQKLKLKREQIIRLV